MNEPISPRRRTRAIAVAALVSVLFAAVSLGLWTTRASGGMRARTMPALRPSSSPAASASSSAVPAESQRRRAHAALGREIFFDASLSEPPGTSCASCHDPAHGFAGNNGSAIGLPRGSRRNHFARRTTPSVLYLKFIPRFHFRFEEDVDLPDGVGGFFWDGRSDSIAALVQQPLLNPDEMNVRDTQQLAEKLRAAPYAEGLRSEFGGGLDTPEAAAAALGQALEAFLTSDTMSPFSSKYDDYVRGRVTLTPLEAMGLKLFKDHAKGACDTCHKLNDSSKNPEHSLFTDYGFEAVAAPRNRRAPGTRDAKRFDLGLCERHDHPHMDEERLCGSFRTPSLRNVATRTSFMHNGTFSTLRDVVAFYATRGTDPKRWYKSGTFDDMPPKFRENVNVATAPYNGAEGQAPAFDDREIDAIVAFLQTLTDTDYPR